MQIKFGVRTARAAVEAALQAAVTPMDYSAVLAAYGSGGIADDYDPKALHAERDASR
jgi:hypothetical protein